MDRRMFIDSMTASMVAAPLVAMAQSSPRVRRIATLTNDGPHTREALDRRDAPLRALAGVEGRNLHVERRYASGNAELLARFAEELVRLDVEIIGTLGTPAALAAKAATKTIPIVIYSAADPVGSGPGGEHVPPGRKCHGLLPVGSRDRAQARRAASGAGAWPAAPRCPGHGQSLLPRPTKRLRADVSGCRCSAMFFEVATPGDVDKSVAKLARRGAQALMIPQEPIFFENPAPLMAAVSRHGLPTVVANGSILDAGALVLLDIPPGGAERTLCLVPRQDPPRRQAGRPSGSAADEIQAGHQPESSRGARPRLALRSAAR